MHTEDCLLLDRWAKQRDAAAFSALVRRYAAMVYAVSKRILQSPDQAEDVSQECFLKLAQVPQPGRLHLPAWLHRVATNRALSVLREETRRRRTELRSLPWREQSRKELAWEDIEGQVDEAIEALRESLRLPVVAHFLERRTHEEIARDLGVSRETVTYRIKRGVETLRRFLARRGFTVAPVALAGGLAGRMVEASLPRSLVATLGKLALSGSCASLRAGVRSYSAARIALCLSAALLCLTAAFVFLPSDADRKAFVASSKVPEPAGAQPRVTVASRPGLEQQVQPTTEPLPPSPATQMTPGPPEIPGATVSGRVVSEDNVPASGAHVYLLVYEERLTLDPELIQSSRWLETRADWAGRFQLTDIPFTGLALPGARSVGLAGVGKASTLQPGDTIEDIVITLSPARNVTGSVVAADGSPVSDAIVSTYWCWSARKRWQGGIGLSATGDDGRFVIGLMPLADRITLRVNSLTRGQAFFQDLPAGDTELRLVLEGPARIEGRVTWDDASPGEGVLVIAVGRVPVPGVPGPGGPGLVDPSQHSRQCVADRAGRYRLDELSPGLEYEVHVGAATAEAYQERHTLRTGEVKVLDRTVSKDP